MSPVFRAPLNSVLIRYPKTINIKGDYSVVSCEIRHVKPNKSEIGSNYLGPDYYFFRAALVHCNQRDDAKWFVGIAEDAVDQLFVQHLVQRNKRSYLYLKVSSFLIADRIAKELAKEHSIEIGSYSLGIKKRMVYAYHITDYTNQDLRLTVSELDEGNALVQ